MPLMQRLGDAVFQVGMQDKPACLKEAATRTYCLGTSSTNSIPHGLRVTSTRARVTGK